MTIVQHLARRRVPLGFATAVVAIFFARPTWWTLLWGGGIAAVGETIRVWAAGHVEKGREVTSSGPYRWVRHPLYVGSVLMGAGFAVAAWHPVASAIVLVYVGATILSAIRVEDAWMRLHFGDEYEEYRGGRLPPHPRRFDMRRTVANREHRAIAGMLALLLWLAWRAST